MFKTTKNKQKEDLPISNNKKTYLSCWQILVGSSHKKHCSVSSAKQSNKSSRSSLHAQCLAHFLGPFKVHAPVLVYLWIWHADPVRLAELEPATVGLLRAPDDAVRLAEVGCKRGGHNCCTSTARKSVFIIIQKSRFLILLRICRQYRKRWNYFLTSWYLTLALRNKWTETMILNTQDFVYAYSKRVDIKLSVNACTFLTLLIIMLFFMPARSRFDKMMEVV